MCRAQGSWLEFINHITFGMCIYTGNYRWKFLFVSQLRVVAYDTGVSRLRATAECYITVRRNLNGPVFNPATYEVTIREELAVNTYIQKLNVSDPDGVSVFLMQWYFNHKYTSMFYAFFFLYCMI